MELLYLGSFFPEEHKSLIISNSKGVIQNAGDTFQKALLDGLIAHKQCDYIITSPMLGSFPKRYKKLFYYGTEFKYGNVRKSVSLGFNNLTLYKTISKYWTIKKELDIWSSQSIETKKCIIAFSLDIATLRAIYKIKKTHKSIHVCLIVTDLFEFMVVPQSLISNLLIKILKYKSSKYIGGVDSFVLLTKYMRNKLRIGQRPFIVVEAILNGSVNLPKKQDFNSDTKVVMYSGTLAKKYGIIHLLNSFSMIEDNCYRLWICGDGDAKQDIIKRQLHDKRIIYYGQLERDEVLSLQKKATVLINPRLSDSEFTKYSFASKTIEYLYSGTPLIMHPLQCLTDDYFDHIYIATDESDVGLRDKIVEVCSKDNFELNEFGLNAAKFVSMNKNAYKQVEKILNMINNEA